MNQAAAYLSVGIVSCALIFTGHVTAGVVVFIVGMILAS